NTGNAHAVEFQSVTLTGSATFSPKTPGFGSSTAVASDLALDNIGQSTAGAGITMAGLRTLTVNGTSTYTGPTIVNSGTLLMNATHTGGGAYSVASGATLGGTGSIGSAVTVAAGGSLAPGSNGIGALATSSVNLAGTLKIDLNDSDPLVQDVLNVTGALTWS